MKPLFKILFIEINILFFTLTCNKDYSFPKEGKMIKYKYEIWELDINGNKIYAEVADTNAKKIQGLMYRKKMDENKGMIFLYKESQYMNFWMKNTYIPLSIAYIDENFKILEIYDMKPKDETSISSKNKVKYALEVNKGWYKKKGIKIGDSIRIIKKIKEL